MQWGMKLTGAEKVQHCEFTMPCHYFRVCGFTGIAFVVTDRCLNNNDYYYFPFYHQFQVEEDVLSSAVSHHYDKRCRFTAVLRHTYCSAEELLPETYGCRCVARD